MSFLFLLEQFKLVIEYMKTEIFWFSRSHTFYPSSLDLNTLGGPLLHSKKM